MRHLLSILVVTVLLASLAWGQQSVGPKHIVYPSKMDVSLPLRDMAKPVPAWTPNLQPPREIPNRFDIRKGSQGQESLDQALQSAEPARTFGPPTLNFEGVGVNGFLPPDTNFDVGLTHIMQMVNIQTQIWDKTGTSVLGPFASSDFWAGFGGSCEFQNGGDAIVLYDQLAGRWLASQFADAIAPNAVECVAVSTSEDPTGTYRRFSFPTPGNDYPKLGVMEDAYYATVRNFTAFTMDAYAFERSEMINAAGTPQLVSFSMGTLGPRDGFLPPDLDGATPPPTGAPGVFLGHDDPSNNLVMFELFADWNNVANSTLVGPTNFSVTAFDTFFPSGIPQPTTNQNLDDLAFFMMHRLAYRNFGTHQTLVANHTVDVNDYPNHAGIRWYELRNAGATNGPWTVRQQSTYSPDSDNRWMGSIAMNGNGDIMVGYSVSSNTTFPSIRYTGRQAGDPLNQMTFAEGLVIAGGGAQLHASGRWGDYSAMTIDPSDDMTFCYTTEYLETTGSAPWQTRIASFQANNGAPLVAIDATTIFGDTVIIGGGGIILDLDITVDNNDSSPLSAQVWNTISIESFEVGPVGRIPVVSINVPAFGQFDTTFVFEMPGGIRLADFPMNWKVGTFPNVQLDRDVILLRKTSGPTFTKAGSDDWGLGPVQEAAVPEEFVLEQNYPNPFNPSTQIRYGLDEQTHVKLSIYNTLGQEVATLVNEVQDAGFQTVSWNGTDNLGQQVAAGVYVYRLEAGNNVQIKKMTFTK